MPEPRGSKPEPQEAKPLDPDDILRILKLKKEDISSIDELGDALDGLETIDDEHDRNTIAAFEKWLDENKGDDSFPEYLKEYFFGIQKEAGGLIIGIEPLKPEEISKWYQIIKEEGRVSKEKKRKDQWRNPESLSPTDLRNAVFTIYQKYQTKDRKIFQDKKGQGKFPLRSHIKITKGNFLRVKIARGLKKS